MLSHSMCYHHVPLILLVVIAGTDKERPGCSKIKILEAVSQKWRKNRPSLRSL